MDEVKPSLDELERRWHDNRAVLHRVLEDEDKLTKQIVEFHSRDEIRRLKLALFQVKMDMKDALDDLASVQEELDASYQIQRTMSTLRKPFSHPPPEILCMIFERTIPPEFLIDTSHSFCPNYIWARVQEQKHAIVNVCRAWHRIGLPFLYKRVTIRHASQLPNLLRTLKQSDSSELVNMIKTVEVQCHVPIWWTSHFEKLLKILLSICPQISACVLRFAGSHIPLPKETPIIGASFAHITSLALDATFEKATLENAILLVAPHIISLSFHIPQGLTDTALYFPEPVHFPHLQHLSVSMSRHASRAHEIPRAWEMPNLQRVTFDLNFYRGDLQESVRGFCKHHGAKLQYLQISSCSDSLIGEVLSSCPNLRHIVIPPTGTSLTHRKVEWIDVYMPDGDADFLSSIRTTPMHTSGMPSLKGVRFISPFLLSCCPNISLLIPPDLVPTSSDEFSCQFLEWGVRHEVAHLSHLPGTIWLQESYAEGQESGDESYIDDDANDTESEHSDSSSVWDFYDMADDHEWRHAYERESELTALETEFPWLDD